MATKKIKAPKLTAFDAADYIKGPADALEYLKQSFETCDKRLVAMALESIAHAFGIGAAVVTLIQKAPPRPRRTATWEARPRPRRRA